MKEVYKNSYFLHIPKCGGRYFYHNIYPSFLKHSGLPEIKEEGSAHKFWINSITDQTFVVCLLRNPINHLVSLYAHSVALTDRGLYKEDLTDEIVKDFLDEKNFVSWILNNKNNISNYQSRNIVLTNSHEEDSFLLAKLANTVIDKDLLMERISKITFLLKMEDQNDSTSINILKNMLKKTDKKGPYYLNPLPANTFYNKYSGQMLEGISQTTKDMISEINSIDMEVYSLANFDTA